MRIFQQPARQKKYWNQVYFLSGLIHFTPMGSRIASFGGGKGWAALAISVEKAKKK